MPANFNVLYSQQYSAVVELVAQQTRPRIVSSFTPESITGQQATVVNLVDVGEAEIRTELYTPIAPGDVVHTRPWIFPINCDKAVFFDTIEAMQSNVSPQSSYVQGIVTAINRKMEDEGIAAMWRSRMVGQQGTTPEAFEAITSRTISVDIGGTGSNLNVEKLQAVLEAMRGQEVGLEDGEQINIAISPKQERSMMNEIEAISSDFTSKRLMDAGTMAGSGYMGFNWIVSNRLLLDGSGNRQIPVWTARGMSFGTWGGGMSTKVSQREDLRGHPWQAYGQGHYGSVRRDEKRVWRILALES